MVGVLAVTLGFFILVSFLLYQRVLDLTDQVGDAIDHEHAKCIAHVTQYVGDQYAASVLEAAAHDYDIVEENHRLKVLARLRYSADGPSVPALWLQDRADRLRGLKVSEEAV